MKITVQLAALQFFSYAAIALLGPYINLFLRSVGFSATNIGVLLSIAALLQLTVTPILTTLADRKGKHRNLYVWYVSGAITAALILITADRHFLLAVAVIISQMSLNPGRSLAAQLTISRLDEQDKDIFGNIRSLGSLGYGIASALSGVFFTLGGYVMLFIAGILMEFSALGFMGGLAEQTNAEGSLSDRPPPRRLEFYILLVSMFFVVIGVRAGFAFLFIHINENLDVPTERIGWIIAFLALIEIPFMLIINPLIRRWGIWKVFFLGVFGNSLIWFMIGVVPGVIWLIPTLILRACFFTSYVIASTLLIARISHPQNVVTNQALAQVTAPGVAALLTGSLAGWLFDNVGAGGLYTMCCVVGIMGGAIMWFGRMYLQSSRYLARQARLAQ